MDIADPEAGQQASAANTNQSATELPGNGSDRYRINSTLGAGGMGIVYLADDLKLHRQVAIKKLRDDVASQNARERIQQEARLLAQLNHPNIVALHDVLGGEESDSGDIALVMEYIEGTTLRAWMRERSPSLQQKLGLLMQICKGLSEAHNLGIIHRDLKSDNILIAENSKGEAVAKITDFGIAKSQQLDEQTLTAENQLAGTITAMSPEQILGKTLDARSDLFSLGTIAYELLCGSRPFEKHEGGALAMANRITSEPHTPPQQAWAEIPEPLAVLLDKLLAKDPARRPQSALIVYQGFALLHKQGLEADSEDYTATLTDLFTQQKVKSRRRWQRVLTGIAATVVLSAGGYWSWKEITRLEPQYIAVMPVEINGEIRGEENAKALTRTMVRQALMNSVSQLKASALVSFTPKEGQDFEAQLQALQNRGVTGALHARLECAQTRCNIDLQLISPLDQLVKQQANITFLTNKQQEAQYRTTNEAIELFSPSYRHAELRLTAMSNSDYSSYLDILGRMENKALEVNDLNDLILLSSRYPRNSYIYQGAVDVAARLFVLNGHEDHLQSALRLINQAEDYDIPTHLSARLKLFIFGLGNYPEKYHKLIAELEKTDFPVAELLSERSRHFYREGDYQAGLKYANEASELNPSVDNFYLKALNEISSGSYDDARSTLNRITSKAPNHWSSYAALGVIELESGNLTAAESAISAIPPNLRSWRTSSNLGVIYFLQGKYKAALNTYQKVHSTTPESALVTSQIAETQLALGNIIEAKKSYTDVLNLTNEKDDLESQQLHILALANLGNTSKAISLAHKLVQKYPEDTYIKYSAAQAYALAEEWHSVNYYVEQLLNQGMSAEWFNLPAFQRLCTQPKISIDLKAAICS
ncbi:serine/threonine-protein kinase [Microbulbifer sp. ALW1]|uniref:serine/threonine-protein kinase n=1 Tax=Microbulbifer sp. (strain ALW1) TaxID=1516059 RepID=UPI00135A8BB8|nr:serine/threonine-protein kinase [Microbulbifer sp. ALW1]